MDELLHNDEGPFLCAKMATAQSVSTEIKESAKLARCSTKIKSGSFMLKGGTMKIAQSNVNLVSQNRYYEENTVTVQSGTITRSSFLDSLQNQEKKLDSLELTTSENEGAALTSESYTSLKPSKTEYLSPYESTLEDQIAELRNTILERLMRLLQLFGGDNQSRGFKQTLTNTANMLTSNSFVKVTTVTATHIMEEETTFSGTGTALTEDGRAIDFGVNFTMSKKLCEYASVSVGNAVSFIDPLVINVGSDITSISDQSFFFDLDCDGKEEKISGLGKGCGFLAYDKNGDGKIGDGSELFGTKSGNGFKDLSVYDRDNNGWIDENDEIYDHLKIWIRNEDGTETLLGLKESDVGAIYLGSVETTMSQHNSEFVMAAMLRSSGLFLRESGGVGTVSQLDLAAME